MRYPAISQRAFASRRRLAYDPSKLAEQGCIDLIGRDLARLSLMSSHCFILEKSVYEILCVSCPRTRTKRKRKAYISDLTFEAAVQKGILQDRLHAVGHWITVRLSCSRSADTNQTVAWWVARRYELMYDWEENAKRVRALCKRDKATFLVGRMKSIVDAAAAGVAMPLLDALRPLTKPARPPPSSCRLHLDGSPTIGPKRHGAR